MRNAATRIPLSVPWNPHRTWPIESFIYATNIGAGLFAERKRYGISFLKNDSSGPSSLPISPSSTLTGRPTVTSAYSTPCRRPWPWCVYGRPRAFPSGSFSHQGDRSANVQLPALCQLGQSDLRR